jgi:hypothetical protein
MTSGPLTSASYAVDSSWDAIELCFERGWTDGLPVVPPTGRAIVAFLDAGGLEPDQVIGTIPERDRIVTAEKLAINAVMAGCRPEYMPVLVAATEALTDPAFRFNHLASLGSPWPLMIVSGPLVRELGLNYGIWALGPGCRANATIGRTLSLLVSNCALGHLGGLLRGTYGHPGRFNSLCIGENPEDFGWEPHNVEMGFDRDTTVVTLLSTYPWMQQPTCVQMEPERILAAISGSIAEGDFVRGVYPIIMGRPWAEVFVRAGWTKGRMAEWMVEHTSRSVASLKGRGRWGVMTSQFDDFGAVTQEIRPGDESTQVWVWKESPLDPYVFDTSAVARRKGMYFVVAGGDGGTRTMWLTPYQFSTNPVTKPVRTR